MASLTEAEAAVYDRQLRVWGLEVQNRLSAARVLIAGGGGLAAEVAKNIVLAGVGLVTLVDDTPSSSAPSGNFLVTASSSAHSSVAQASAATLQAMNPLVKVVAAAGSPTSLDAALIADHDITLATGLSLGQVEELDKLVTRSGKCLFAGSVRGSNSYIFNNLQAHSYSEKEKPGIHELPYVSFTAALDVPLSKLKKRSHPLYPILKVCAAYERAHGVPPAPADIPALGVSAAQLASAEKAPLKIMRPDLLEAFVEEEEEFAPVSAIVGGVVANHIVRTISKVGAPFRNLFFFGLFDGNGVVEDMQ